MANGDLLICRFADLHPAGQREGHALRRKVDRLVAALDIVGHPFVHLPLVLNKVQRQVAEGSFQARPYGRFALGREWCWCHLCLGYRGWWVVRDSRHGGGRCTRHQGQDHQHHHPRTEHLCTYRHRPLLSCSACAKRNKAARPHRERPAASSAMAAESLPDVMKLMIEVAG